MSCKMIEFVKVGGACNMELNKQLLTQRRYDIRTHSLGVKVQSNVECVCG